MYIYICVYIYIYIYLYIPAGEMIFRNLLNELGTEAKFQVVFNLLQLLNN